MRPLVQGEVTFLVSGEYRAEVPVEYFENLLKLAEHRSQIATWHHLQQNQHSGLVEQTAFLESLRSMTNFAYERFLARRLGLIRRIIERR